MKEAIIISFFNTLVLLVWFQTNAFIEYFGKFPFISKVVDNFNKMNQAGLSTSFTSFLALNYNSFIIRLITCPYCLNFWMTLVTSFFVGYKFFALIYVISLIYYMLILKLNKHE